MSRHLQPELRANGPLRIGSLEAPLPIVQGGMGIGVSLGNLAAAVSLEGGIGVISAACIARTPRYLDQRLSDAEALKLEIARCRDLGASIVGVNIMVALQDYEKLALAASEAGADIIFAGAGLPLELPALVQPGSRTALVPIVSSGKAAVLITRWWQQKHGRRPDALVVEGPMAGGHLGFKLSEIDDGQHSLDQLIQEVGEALVAIREPGQAEIPLIAAGGVFDGADIRRCLSLGAQGVQLGTRFVATEECDAPQSFKQAYLDAKEEDILIVQSPVGMPGRALKNRFIHMVNEGLGAPRRCGYRCIRSCKREKGLYCIAEALLTSIRGAAEEGLVFVGANAWRVKELCSVKALIQGLEREFRLAGI